MAATIALPSLLGARAGVLIAKRLSSEMHAFVFNSGSIALLPTHFMVQRWRQQQQSTSEATQSVGTMSLACYGCAAGAFSALMGVGGGPLAVSFLSLATPLPHHLIQGTAACAVVPGMLASGALYALDGKLPLRATAAVTLGAALGGLCGSQVAL